jgi:hypothetical protein
MATPIVNGVLGNNILGKDYWGPRVWRLLHTLSCYPGVGTTKAVVLARDERSAWLHMLKALGQIMPCDRCKQHYREWFHVTGILKETMYVGDLRTYIRGALFDLHCSANVDQGKEPAPIVYADLDTAYPPQSLSPIVEELEGCWRAALERRLITLDSVRLWRRSVATLLGIYGLV